MTRSGYPGAIALVNPKGGEVFGLPIRASLAEVPDPVDLAIILVPAKAAAETLRETARRGIKAFILSSGGFRETGEAGERLEKECLNIARQNGMRMIGPNCVGLLDFHLPLDTTFVTLPIPEKGHLALISQSGAVCGIVMDWAASLGIGFSRMLSLGNMADITETDMLPGIIEDEHTRVILFYIESLQDGQRFMDVAMQANRVKPMVALKVGRSQAGKRAAASHTGALAGEATAYQAALHKAGILQAGTIDELLEWSVALSSCPLPKGDRIAILTNAGGPGVIAADALEGNQLKLAELDAKTVEALSKLLPAAASLRNPVDMLGGATHEMYVKCLELLVADPGVDGIIVVLFPPPLEAAEIIAVSLIRVI
jgi:acetyltransferase